MSLQKHIENLRTKPENVRRRIAFWTSLGVTGFIFVFWLGSFSSNGVGVKQSVATAVDHTGSPSQSLVAGVGAFGKDVWSLIFGSKKVTYSTVEVTSGE